MSDIPPSGETPTVLVVEDDQDLADAYAIWLKPEYEVRTAHSGHEALTWYDPEVDIVLLDRRIPDLTGANVLKHMERRDVHDQKTILTGVEPGRELVDLPCDDYLTKPVGKPQLRDTVRELQLRSQLDDELQRHFTLTSKIAALENGGSADGMESAIDDLRREAERTRARIEDRISELDGIDSAFKSID